MTIQNQHQPGVFTEYGKNWEHGTESCPSSTQETMEQASDKAGGMVSTAADKVKGAAGFVGEKAEQATHAVGAGIESLGHAMHGGKPAEGMFSTAKEAVADKLEGAGRYLEDEGLKGMGQDVTNLIRQHPVPALLIGVGLGFLLARLARR